MRQPASCPKTTAGFSLIELMAAVVIVGILMAVAIPSYKSYLIRGNRTTAKASMMDLASREQQYLIANRLYADTAALTATGYAPEAQALKYYTWAVTVNNSATPPTFTITFTPIATTMQGTDGALTLDSLGNKLPADKWSN